MVFDGELGESLEQRAELAGDLARTRLQLLPNQPVNPLAPEEPRLAQAQIPDRPNWPLQSDQELVEPIPGVPGQPASATPGSGRIRIDARGGGETTLRVEPGDDENVLIVNTPTQITFQGDGGLVELSADRIVVWASKNVVGLGNVDASEKPVEIYLEGNIEFKQAGNRVLAQRMFYDTGRQQGVTLEAELYGEIKRPSRSSLEDFRTPVRVKADVLQQLSPTLFQANNAAFTTSQLGVPQYWLESQTLTLDSGATPLFDQVQRSLDGGLFEGSESELYQNNNESPFSQFDQLLVTSENSRLFVGGVPIFRWPSFSTDLASNPSLYLDRIRVGSDSVFGQQLLTRWNNFQLLGINPRPGVKWTTDLDVLTDRGLGFGTDVDYQGRTFLGQPALTRGYLHSWFINDDGFDNLGFDRRRVEPEESFRGRIDGKHIHLTPSGLQVIGEIGWIRDRNFLEQFREEEFDLQKDKDTRLEIKQYTGSGSWSIGGSVRLNDFVTQTEWLPRIDHYELGRALWGNRLTWYEHSQVGYARLRAADPPTNAVDILEFNPLPYDQNVEGFRAVTRQEVDLPLQLGPLKVVPYALGEAAYWGEDLNGDDVTRLLGQAGVRASLLAWRADPNVYNELFNLNGIAHKVVVDSEFLYADANQDSLDLPLYDPLDDDAVEFFRRRFLFDTFGLGLGDDVPLRFDERTHAFRQGIQRYVAAPSTEIADDLMLLKLGLRHRIQTKRGLPGNQRIIDWFTFDVEGNFFPRAGRDNFGQEIGPMIYDARWHVGDRTTIMSDGYFDFFGDGLRTVSLGAALSRPGRSQYFVGLRSISGPIDSNVFTSSIEYLLSPKWKMEYGTSIDLSETGNIGQSGRIVRIGESLIVGLGAYYDASRNNFGFRFDIAPRDFLTKLGTIGGRPITRGFGLQ